MFEGGGTKKIVGIWEDQMQLVKAKYIDGYGEPASDTHEIVLCFASEGDMVDFLRDINTAAQVVNEETKAGSFPLAPQAHELIRVIDVSQRPAFAFDNRQLLEHSDDQGLHVYNFSKDNHFSTCLEKAGYQIVIVPAVKKVSSPKSPEQLRIEIKATMRAIEKEEMGVSSSSPASAIKR